ncbi:MAG: hypothetical protein ACOYJE_01785 [Bacteroidaceae bacterium]|jgi:hypothetical protein
MRNNSIYSARKNNDFIAFCFFSTLRYCTKGNKKERNAARPVAKGLAPLRQKCRHFGAKAAVLLDKSGGTFPEKRPCFFPKMQSGKRLHEREKTEISPLFAETCYKT